MKPNKTVQYFTPEYLAECRRMSIDDRLRFLEDFKSLTSATPPLPTKLISLKVPEDLLRAFKAKAKLDGVKYQTQIKALMREWLI